VSARIAVVVTPRAHRDEVVGFVGDELAVRVRVPPEDGKANAAVCRAVAESLGVPKSAVRVVRGAGSRHKTLEVDGLDEAGIRAAFPSPPVDPAV